MEQNHPSFGDHRAGVPPVPIPNTEVKPCTADDTALSGRGKVGNRQLTFKTHPTQRVGLHYLTAPVISIGASFNRPLPARATVTT